MPYSFDICYSRMLCLERYGSNAISFFYSSFFLFSNKISHLFFISIACSPQPFTLTDSLVTCFLLFLFMNHLWTNFLFTISQIPASLTYTISFTVFFFFFFLFSLSPFYSNLITETMYDSVWVISKQSIRVSS